MAMGKKKLLAVTFSFVLLVSMLLGVQFVNVSKANMIVLPTEPNTDPPVLIVHSPTNGSSYSGNITLDLTIIKPTSWQPIGYTRVGGIAYVRYILDTLKNPYSPTGAYSLYEQYLNPIPYDNLPTISNFSETIEGLNAGEHIIQVIIHAVTQYSPDNSGYMGSTGGPFYYPDMNVTDTITFTVDPQVTPLSNPTSSPSPKPSPSLIPSPTPSPAPNPTPSSIVPIPVEEVMQNRDSYINQTISVRGWLQSEPLPTPFGIPIGMNGGYGILYVKWDPHVFILDGINASWAIVHGVVKEVNWIEPYHSHQLHDYYIDAQTLDFEPTSSLSPTTQPSITPISTEVPHPVPLYSEVFAFVTVVLVICAIAIYLKRFRK
jgi:hypothetical protein